MYYRKVPKVEGFSYVIRKSSEDNPKKAIYIGTVNDEETAKKICAGELPLPEKKSKPQRKDPEPLTGLWHPDAAKYLGMAWTPQVAQ